MNKKLLGYINSGNVIKFYKSKEWREKRLTSRINRLEEKLRSDNK